MLYDLRKEECSLEALRKQSRTFIGLTLQTM
jgi:hypothetical protein